MNNIINLVSCLLTCVLFINVAPVYSDEITSLQEIEQRLEKHSFIFGEFTQSKSIEGFEHPLISKGHFSYWNEKGLAWLTSTPIFNAITYTKKHTLQWSEDHSLIKKSSPKRIERRIIDILTALIAGDIKFINKKFEIDSNIQESHWFLTLRPKSKTAKKAIRSIEISGNNRIEKFILTSNNMEVTQIDLNNTQSIARPSPTWCKFFFEDPIECNLQDGNESQDI